MTLPSPGFSMSVCHKPTCLFATVKAVRHVLYFRGQVFLLGRLMTCQFCVPQFIVVLLQGSRALLARGPNSCVRSQPQQRKSVARCVHRAGQCSFPQREQQRSQFLCVGDWWKRAVRLNLLEDLCHLHSLHEHFPSCAFRVESYLVVCLW